ncbi:MAG: CoA-binding protein [Candidatus Bathyarchaeia archaeon]
MLKHIFNPSSVAIIGASRDPGKTGYIILENIIKAGFKGKIYPINPKADEILGLKAYPSIESIEEQIDLAIVIVPAPVVPSVVEQCSKKGVKGIVVISGGFSETGVEGEKLEKAIAEIIKKAKIRLIGPNCQGINNPHVGLCASWPLITTKGPIAVISQSGTVGATMECWASDEKVGISKFVALGNKADVNEIDLIEAFSEDENTKVISLYLEGVSDGRKFIEVAKKVTKKKPIVILKSGRTKLGIKAVMSHTRSLAGKDEIYDAAFKQSGVLRVEDIEELYDVSKALSLLKFPKGNKVLIITSSGGSGILSVDLCEKLGIALSELPESIKENLKKKLPPYCIISNPIDLTGDATAERYGIVIQECANAHEIDVFFTIFGDPIVGAAEVIKESMEKTEKPIVVVFLGGGEVEKSEKEKMQYHGIPVFPTPERGIKALNALIRYSSMLSKH